MTTQDVIEELRRLEASFSAEEMKAFDPRVTELISTLLDNWKTLLAAAEQAERYRKALTEIGAYYGTGTVAGTIARAALRDSATEDQTNG